VDYTFLKLLTLAFILRLPILCARSHAGGGKSGRNRAWKNSTIYLMKKSLQLLLLVSAVCSIGSWPLTAQAAEPVSTPPAFGTFYFATGGPPFPFDPRVRPVARV
jgi:hypothetical protein